MTSIDEAAPAAPRRDRAELPLQAELALVGSLLIAVGVFGPWVAGSGYAGGRGFELGGGDGWVVFAAAAATVAAIANPFRRRVRATGLAVATFAGIAGYVCGAHLAQLSADGVSVGWGLYAATVGAALVGLAGLRIAAVKRLRYE
jgi:hypothetical protein